MPNHIHNTITSNSNNNTLNISSVTASAKGLIQPALSTQHFQLYHHPPSPALTQWIAYFWEVRWDLTNQPAYTQQNLPHPAQHLIVNPFLDSGIMGVHTRRFEYKLQGKGQVLGCRFNFGALAHLLSVKPKLLNDVYSPVERILPLTQSALDERVREDNLSQAIQDIEQAVLAVAQPLSSDALLAGKIVEAIEANRAIVQVEQLAEQFAISVRKLQRLFADYIGVSAKWTICRYRLFEVLAELDKQPQEQLIHLANRMGYYDQAHFNRVFKAMVGVTPSEYASGIT